MDCLIGIKGKDFVLMASDSVASAHGVLMMKRDHDKMFKLGSNLLMSVHGDGGDDVQFAEYIAKNIQLYRMRNGYSLSTKAAATFTRRNLADYLRSSSAYMVNLLIGGYDDEAGPSLYFMDYLASMTDVPFAVHGYAALFTLSTLDRYYRPDINKDEAVALLKQCVDELATRFVINLPSFTVKIVDKDGIRELDQVKPTAVVHLDSPESMVH